ncbi:MAG: hypoxanthine phosphoribosyltransferase [Desulfovibrio sp.]|nr:hypoxanthine phosphoribosyltransferase [Desulfovibrio sp.]
MPDTPRLKIVFTGRQIGERVSAIASEINRVYKDQPLVAICVLKGAFMFFGDLVRALDRPDLEVDFVRLASYGKSAVSSGHVRFNKDIEIDIRNKNVLVIEDIVDSGRSMRFLLDQLSVRAPASLSLAALVDKKERRIEEVRVDFGGFVVPSGFLVGYGLDYAEKYRSLPDICELEFTDKSL